MTEPLFENTELRLGSKTITGPLLYVPDADTNLLGRDLMMKLGIQITTCQEGKEGVEHNCLDLTEYQTKVRSDLQDTLLEEGKLLFIDGSSIVVQGKRHNGYAVLEGARWGVREMGRLPNDWSAQI